MAKKTSLPAGFASKTNFQILSGVPAGQKLNATTEWNLGIQDLADSIDENYERLILNWTDDIIADQVLEEGQYIDKDNVIYRVTTGYDVGAGKTFTAGNFQVIHSGVEVNTWHVNKSGNDTTGDGSPQKPYLTIQKSVNVSSDGDIIKVGNGTFSETLTIDKNLTFEGTGNESELSINTEIIGLSITIDNTSAARNVRFVNIYVNPTIAGIVESGSANDAKIALVNCELNTSSLSCSHLTAKSSKLIVSSLNVRTELYFLGCEYESSDIDTISGTATIVNSLINADVNVDGDLKEYNSKISGTIAVSGSHTILSQTADLTSPHRLYVDASSPNIPGVGTEQNPFRIIQDAIDAVTIGTTIIIAEGAYVEDLTIDETIIIEGSGSESNNTSTRITGDLTVNLASARFLRLQGLRITGDILKSGGSSSKLSGDNIVIAATNINVDDFELSNSELIGTITATGFVKLLGCKHLGNIISNDAAIDTDIVNSIVIGDVTVTGTLNQNNSVITGSASATIDHFIKNQATQDLQSVTDAGATTDNNVTIENSFNGTLTFKVKNVNTGTGARPILELQNNIDSAYIYKPNSNYTEVSLQNKFVFHSGDDWIWWDGSTIKMSLNATSGLLNIFGNLLIIGQATTNDDTVKTFTATPEFDFDEGNDHQMTLTGNVTAFTTTNELGSANYDVWLINDATPGRTVASPTGWTEIPGGDTHDTSADAINLYQFKTSPDGTIKRFIIKNM